MYVYVERGVRSQEPVRSSPLCTLSVLSSVAREAIVLEVGSHGTRVHTNLQEVCHSPYLTRLLDFCNCYDWGGGHGGL